MDHSKEPSWEQIEEMIQNCRRCELCRMRHSIVLGEGNRSAEIMLVGEGPGADEDAQGLPFVGRAGQLLTQILKSVEISRKDVYITNIVKCRPPENRVPAPEEAVACAKHLQTQIMLMDPMLIVLLGNTPARWILNTSAGITKIRGKWFDWRGKAVMPMFHPSYLLRNASSREGSPKHLTWLDIQEVKKQWDAVRATGKPDGMIYG